MNASMARRIRRAESLLIYAIDRHYDEQRERSRATQSQTHASRFPVVDPTITRRGTIERKGTSPISRRKVGWHKFRSARPRAP
jgi:hypothetical protein